MCDRCEELEEKIMQLEGDLYARSYRAPHELGLNVSQERMLGVLLRHDRVVSRDTIFNATRDLPAVRVTEAGEKLVQTMISKLRQRLASNGLQIETVYGFGYRLTPETRQRLLNWHQSEAA